ADPHAGNQRRGLRGSVAVAPGTAVSRCRSGHDPEDHGRHGTQRFPCRWRSVNRRRQTRRMHMPATDDRVAILTPDPADSTYAGAWPEVLDRLASALAGAGVAATPTPWTAHVDDCTRLGEFPLVLPLLTWGYHLDHACWLRACRAWRDAGVAMANPAGVL